MKNAQRQEDPPGSRTGPARGQQRVAGLVLDLLVADWKPTRRFAIAGGIWLVIVLLYAALALHGLLIDNADKWFQEGKPGTILSTIVLGAAAGRSFRAHRCFASRPARRFWLALCIALAIAAIDELFKLHEHIEIWFHQIFGIDRHDSPFDWIDDVLVAAYPAVVGVFGLLALRHVLSRTSTIRWWCVGGASFAMMVAMDVGKLSLPTPTNGGLLWEELAKSLAGAGVLAGVLSAIDPGMRPLTKDERLRAAA